MDRSSSNRTSASVRERTKGEEPRYRVEEVRDDYLRNSGVVSAVRDALGALFSEPRLPDNPYYFLSSVLGAYVDQSPLWKETNDQHILLPYDLEGGVTVLQPATGLCGHTGTSHCYGLPHVLRLVSKDGVDTLNRILTDGVPDTLFPTPNPFNTRDGCSVQLLSSIQGVCTVWRPSRTDMPEIQVRTDVLVRGAQLEEAVNVFLDVVLTAVEDVAEVPVYFVDGLSIEDAPSQTYEGVKKQPFYQFYPLQEVLLGILDWEKTAKRLVLGGKCIKMRCALLLEAAMIGQRPAGGGEPGQEQGGGGGAMGGAEASGGGGLPRTATTTAGARGKSGAGGDGPGDQLRYQMATRTFYFHYASLETSKVAYDQMQHYGSLPYDALYQGYFPSLSSANTYMSMYQVDDKVPPYGPSHLLANMNSMRRQIERHLRHGDSLQGFQMLMHLIAMQDRHVTGVSSLSQSAIRPLYALMSRHPPNPPHKTQPPASPPAATNPKSAKNQAPQGGAPVASAVDPAVELFATLPNLMRILTSSAALIQGLTRELEAISSAAASWPAKLARIHQSAAINPTTRVYVQRPDGLYTAPDTGASRRTMRTPEVSSAMISWLRTFDMEGRLLEQLAALKARIGAVVGRGLFSGVSILCELLLATLPDKAPRTGTSKVMARVQPVLTQLVQLLEVGSVTVAQGFLGRCANVVQALQQVGVARVSFLDSRLLPDDGMGNSNKKKSKKGNSNDAVSGVSGVTSVVVTREDEEPALQEWSLDVTAVTGSQVRSGGLAARVGAEGVMLQYAIDTQLDEALNTLWLQVSQPPQPLNPFPKLMHLIRSRAAKMELWREQMDPALGHLMAELVMVQPPSFIYAGQASESRIQARKKRLGRRSGGGAGAQVAEEEPRVYGSYAAVSLADARQIQQLAARLPGLLEARHWKHGAYQGEVIPCLLGDASLSSALDMEEPPPAPSGHTPLNAKEDAGGSHAVEGLRFHQLHCQEVHLVQGPTRREAAQVFSQEVVRSLCDLHQHTPHLLYQLHVYLPPACKQAQAVTATRRQQQQQQQQQQQVGVGSPPPLTGSPPHTVMEVHAGAIGMPMAYPGSGGGGNAPSLGTSGSRPGTSSRPTTPSGTSAGGRDQTLGINISQPPEDVLRGDGGVVLQRVTFGVTELMDTRGGGQQMIMDCLVAATQTVTQGSPLACVYLYAAPLHAGTYLPMRMELACMHAKQPKPLHSNQAMLIGSPPLVPPRPTTAERNQTYWDRSVYERIFLEESPALTWSVWNTPRGDPAQPYHQQRLLSDCLSGVRSLLAGGRLVEAHKLALRAATALHDDVGIYELSRTCSSAAQDLTALMDLNLSLRQLLSPEGADPAFFAKRDNERLRRLFLTYCSRLRRALSSPKSCYFSSLPEMARPLIDTLKAHVLSTFTLGPSHVSIMEHLGVWTRACEISVAAALHDCFSPAVRNTWLASAGAAGGGGGGGGGSVTGASVPSSIGDRGAGSLVLRPSSAQHPNNNSSRPPSASRHTLGAGGGGGAGWTGHRHKAATSTRSPAGAGGAASGHAAGHAAATGAGLGAGVSHQGMSGTATGGGRFMLGHADSAAAYLDGLEDEWNV